VHKGAKMSNGIKDRKPLLVAFTAACVVWSMILLVQAAPQTAQPEVTRQVSQGTLYTSRSTSAGRPLSCEPLVRVDVLGPDIGAVDTTYAFVGVVSPVTATSPITYSWEAVGQDPVVRPGGSVTDAIEFTWEVTGVKLVTVTVANDCEGTQTDSHSIALGPRKPLYLPFVVRNYFNDPYEPNDTFDEAHGPLVSGQAYISYIPDENDPDDLYFAVVGATAPLRVWLTVPAALDLDLYVYNEEHSRVSMSNVAGKGVDEALSFTPAEAGTYFIRIYPFAGWSMSSPYTLLATFDAAGN
jgi:hypothetical protein